jgi:hypothetical protein
LAIATSSFGNKTRIFHHSFEVEVAAERVEDGEENVQERVVEE